MKKEVTILGCGPSAAILHNEGTLVDKCMGEIWTLNNAWVLYGFGFKVDRWFAPHPADAVIHYADPYKRDAAAILNRYDCPVYMTETTSRIKHATFYDFPKISKALGSCFYKGTPSLMLMMAIYEGVTDLCVYGVDMGDPEHWRQRASWAYWIRAAEETGMKMHGNALAFMGQDADNEHGLRGPYDYEAMRERQKRRDSHG